MHVKSYNIIRSGLGSPMKANELMRWERLDNIGPARYAELDQLRGATIRPVK